MLLSISEMIQYMTVSVLAAETKETNSKKILILHKSGKPTKKKFMLLSHTWK